MLQLSLFKTDLEAILLPLVCIFDVGIMVKDFNIIPVIQSLGFGGPQLPALLCCLHYFTMLASSTSLSPLPPTNTFILTCTVAITIQMLLNFQTCSKVHSSYCYQIKLPTA